MPKISEIRKEYNLPRSGQKIGNAVVESVSIKHKVVKRYRIYEFPFSIVVRGRGVVSKLTSNLRGRHIVYSPYGNPYACRAKFSTSYVDGKRVVKGTIHCERIFTEKNKEECWVVKVSGDIEGAGDIEWVLPDGYHVDYDPFNGYRVFRDYLECMTFPEARKIARLIRSETGYRVKLINIYAKQNPKPVKSVAYVNCYARRKTAEKRIKRKNQIVVPKMHEDGSISWCVVDAYTGETDFDLYHGGDLVG